MTQPQETATKRHGSGVTPGGRQMSKAALLFVALAVLALGASFQRDRRDSAVQVSLPPVTAHPLVSNAGVPVVEIFDARAEGTAQRVEKYFCRVRNTSDKGIVALTLVWTTIWSAGEKTHPERMYHHYVWMFPGAQALAPGDVVADESSGSQEVEGAFVKDIQVSVDYVEFADGTRLGPDTSAASRRSALLRRGAEACREGLLHTYRRRGSEGVLEKLRQGGEEEYVEFVNKKGLGAETAWTPQDLSYIKQGVRACRQRLLGIYREQGLPVLLEKLLDHEAK